MLTIKQVLFIKKYFDLNNATEAAYQVYQCKSRNAAAVTGYRLLRNVNVASAIDTILDGAGLTDGAIAQNLKEMVNLGSIRGIKLALKLKGFGNI